MLKRNTLRFIIGFFMLFALLGVGGCGSGNSDTNGLLTLTVTPTDQTGGQWSVKAVATFSSASATSLVGVPIKITMVVRTLSGVLSAQSKTLYTDASGSVEYSINVVQGSDTAYVDVTASTGGLSQSTTVTVPHL